MTALQNILCRIGLHGYRTVRDNGKTVYRQCAWCDKRDAWQRPGGHQPIDDNWLEGKKDNPLS